MTGPANVGEKTIMGSFRAHQVPLPLAKTDDSQLAQLQSWLDSYDFHKLLATSSASSTSTTDTNSQEGYEQVRKQGFSQATDAPGALFTDEALRILPPRMDRRLGMIKETYNSYEPLDVPDFKEFVSDKTDEQVSPMKATAGAFIFAMCTYLVLCGLVNLGLTKHFVGIALLKEVIKRNPKSFRIFSPDGTPFFFHLRPEVDFDCSSVSRLMIELGSNKLDSVFEITNRQFQWDPESKWRARLSLEY